MNERFAATWSVLGKAKPLLCLCFFCILVWACQSAEPQGAATLSAASATPPAKPLTQPPAPPPITSFPVLDFDDAVLAAANEVLSKVAAVTARQAGDGAPGLRRVFTIDPLVDSQTSQRLVATRSMQAQISGIIRDRYPQFDLQPFTIAALASSPLVLIGTLTAIDADGRAGAADDAYRVWLTVIDLRAGTIIAKARARARFETVDATPTPTFRDSPVWTRDAATEAYIQTCHDRKVGDPIPPSYFDRLFAAAMINDAIEAYDAGRYEEALSIFTAVQGMQEGDQLRVYNGLYLTTWKLGREHAATAAFGQVIEYGLKQDRLAIKFLFRPGSIAFWPDPDVSGAYPMWIQQLAQRATKHDVCLEITGHSSRTGPEPLNERLSLLRAESIERRLEAEAPALGPRMIANGVGSRENLIGTGTDDAVDALDRRVEFKLPPC